MTAIAFILLVLVLVIVLVGARLSEGVALVTTPTPTVWMTPAAGVSNEWLSSQSFETVGHPRSVVDHYPIGGQGALAVKQPLETADYDVAEIDDVLTPEQCDAIIAAAKARGMTNAETMDIGNPITHTSYNPIFRTSKAIFLPDSLLPETELLAAQAEARTGLPRENQEQLQVAHYAVGGEFKDHYDACDGPADACVRFNRGAGHRVATLLVYLNDDFDGGETVFPRIGKAVRPRKGKGVLFRNTDADEVILHNSLHRASQVTRGEKWICTKWVHSGRFA